MKQDFNRVRHHFPYHLILTCASLVVIVTGLKLGSGLVVPVLLALFLAILCSRPVKWLHGRGVSVNLSIFIVLMAVVAVLGGLGWIISLRLDDFVDQFARLEGEMRDQYSALLSWFNSLGLPIDVAGLRRNLDPSVLLSSLPSLLGGIGNFFTQLVIVIILTIFILFETLDFPYKLSQAINRPDGSVRRFTQFSGTLQRYLLVKTVISAITGGLITICCLVLQVEFALLWGVMAFFFNYIPNIGSIIAAIPAVLLTLVMPEGGLIKAALLGSAYSLINFLLGNLIEPRIMGQTLGMSTLTAFMSLVFWGWLFGPVGLFLSVPLTMSLKIVLDSHPDTRWLSVLMGPNRRRRERAKEGMPLE
ncbi:AI-2E family transporter [Kushneria aurantia]|uniref:AI-2E family transporter n=1 Tax=Kushneria aurantia TaxID=504092 RepID=A0ABV6G7R0_9GAMM|nr:AI-2E family transporter [Kushneria aurantia]